jgi:phosphoserine phosphatase
MDVSSSLLVTVRGDDRPGIAAWVFGVLEELGRPVLDVEQIQVHGRLLLCVEVGGVEVGGVEVGGDDDGAALCRHFTTTGGPLSDTLEVSVTPFVGAEERDSAGRHLVHALAPEFSAGDLAALFAAVARSAGNVDRIVRLATYPVTSYELVISGADSEQLRRELAEEAARRQVDVSVQRAGLHRRAKHLIVLDADSTLLQGEVIDLLAARAGHAEAVVAITEAAMAGQIDFSEALKRRVALLAGLSEGVLAAVRDELALTPGARTLVRTLKRLGYATAVVSGGFIEVLEPLTTELGIDHVAANSLEVRDGVLTGQLQGPIVDRRGKAEALTEFATKAGVPLSRTIAVGDGANDLDMLALAGLGIAFNARPVVRDAADTALNVPYLDAILFMLGISREEIEAADREDDSAN